MAQVSTYHAGRRRGRILEREDAKKKFVIPAELLAISWSSNQNREGITSLTRQLIV